MRFLLLYKDLNVLYVETNNLSLFDSFTKNFTTSKCIENLNEMCSVEPLSGLDNVFVESQLNRQNIPYYTDFSDLSVISEAEGGDGIESYKGIFINRNSGDFKILSGRFPDKKAMIYKHGVEGKPYIARKVLEAPMFKWIEKNAKTALDGYLMYSTAPSKWRDITMLKDYYYKAMEEMPEMFSKNRQLDVISGEEGLKEGEVDKKLGYERDILDARTTVDADISSYNAKEVKNTVRVQFRDENGDVLYTYTIPKKFAFLQGAAKQNIEVRHSILDLLQSQSERKVWPDIYKDALVFVLDNHGDVDANKSYVLSREEIENGIDKKVTPKGINVYEPNDWEKYTSLLKTNKVPNDIISSVEKGYVLDNKTNSVIDEHYGYLTGLLEVLDVDDKIVSNHSKKTFRIPLNCVQPSPDDKNGWKIFGLRDPKFVFLVVQIINSVKENDTRAPVSVRLTIDTSKTHPNFIDDNALSNTVSRDLDYWKALQSDGTMKFVANISRIMPAFNDDVVNTEYRKAFGDPRAIITTGPFVVWKKWNPHFITNRSHKQYNPMGSYIKL